MIEIIQYDYNATRLEWKPLALAILERAPDTDKVLSIMAELLWPTSWSGSLADILEQRIVLLQNFLDSENDKILEWARKYHSMMQSSIANDRKQDEHRNRQVDESFE